MYQCRARSQHHHRLVTWCDSGPHDVSEVTAMRLACRQGPWHMLLSSGNSAAAVRPAQYLSPRPAMVLAISGNRNGHNLPTYKKNTGSCWRRDMHTVPPRLAHVQQHTDCLYHFGVIPAGCICAAGHYPWRSWCQHCSAADHDGGTGCIHHMEVLGGTGGTGL